MQGWEGGTDAVDKFVGFRVLGLRFIGCGVQGLGFYGLGLGFECLQRLRVKGF